MDAERLTDTTRLLLDQIADKWTILILGALCHAGGRARFNAMRRDVGEISPKSLAQGLRRLERNGLIERTVLPTAPIGVEYAVTPLGHTLKEPFQALQDWAQLHLADVDAARHRFDRAAEQKQSSRTPLIR
jgi:DNA-binding HxlR family transcriptional regulator